MLQAPIPNVSSVFYAYVASISNTCLKCFICLLLYVASVASRCFKSRSVCCTCCNNVLNVSYVLDVCCKNFHLDVTKVDWDVKRRGRWLLLLPGHSRGSTHVDFLVRGASPYDGREVRCWGRTWDADVGAAQVSEPHLDATSCPDARRSAHVYIAAKIHLGT
jgi:hypothetical protein